MARVPIVTIRPKVHGRSEMAETRPDPTQEALNKFYLLPEDLLVKWVAVPSETVLHVAVTKADAERVFFTLNGLFDSFIEFQVMMLHTFAGNPAMVDAINTRILPKTIDRLNDFRRQFETILTRAVGEPFEDKP